MPLQHQLSNRELHKVEVHQQRALLASVILRELLQLQPPQEKSFVISSK
jgi:hypothetical protein